MNVDADRPHTESVTHIVILMGASGDLKDLASNVRAHKHPPDSSEYLRMTSSRRI